MSEVPNSLHQHHHLGEAGDTGSRASLQSVPFDWPGVAPGTAVLDAPRVPTASSGGGGAGGHR